VEFAGDSRRKRAPVAARRARTAAIARARRLVLEVAGFFMGECAERRSGSRAAQVRDGDYTRMWISDFRYYASWIVRFRKPTRAQ